MMRRGPVLCLALAALVTLGSAGPAEAVPDIAWEVRLLTAPWSGGAPDRAELLLDAGSDRLDREIAIKHGSFLSALTGLALGRTEEVGGATVVFPLGEAFTMESAGSQSPFSIDFDPHENPERRGSWSVDLALTAGKAFRRQRTLPLHPHRARLWVLPRASGVMAVLMEAWPAAQPPQMSAPQDTVQVEFALVRGSWRRGVAPSTVVEADFPTWLDPFVLERGQSATALMRPVSAGAADRGTLVFDHSMKVPLNDLGAYERGRRPGDGGEAGDDFLSATVGLREVEPGASRLQATISLQGSQLAAPELVMLRRFEIEDGATQAWIIPTEDALLAVFVRVHRGRRGLARPVHPAG